MTLLEKNLQVKRSTLPGAGKGLFTKKDIAKGKRIVEYKGKIKTWKECDQDIENRYLFYVNSKIVIDANKNKTFARYANDAKGIRKIKGIINNASYTKAGDKVFIEAIKNIPAGCEIFVDYGKEYWDIIKQNNKY